LPGVHDCPSKPRVVVVFVTWSYRKVLANWLAIAPPAIAEMTQIHAYGWLFPVLLRMRGLRVRTVSLRKPSRKDVFRDRVLATIQALRRGEEILICDADAIVLKDFWEELDGVEGAIVSSQGLGYPRVAGKAWGGFSLCCGFTLYRPHKLAIELLSSVCVSQLNSDHDDQTALNIALLNNDVAWDFPGNSYQLQGPRSMVKAFPQPLSGSIPSGQLAGLTVTVLEHSKYQRIEDENAQESPFVVHGFPQSSGPKGIENTLRSRGLWVI
jgi:hypothetical protein